MQGSLSPTYALADVVKGIYGGRRSGILSVRSGAAQKRLYFQGGSFVFSDSNDPEGRLGSLLVERGVLRQEDLERVLTLLAPGKRIGSVVVGLGLLDEGQVTEAVRLQITENVYPIFSWTAGEFSFEEQQQPAPADIAVTLSTANIIMEGIRRIDDPEVVARALGSVEQVVCLGSNPLLRFQAVALKPKEGFILSRIDGLLTIEQICSISPVPTEDVLKCIYGLKSTGVLEVQRSSSADQEEIEDRGDIASFFSDFGGVEQLLGAATAVPLAAGAELSSEQREEVEEIRQFAARLGELDHYQVLGVEATVSDGDIRKAYYRLAKTYHPDRHHRSHLVGVQAQLERIFVRVNEAYETLRAQTRRTKYDRKRTASENVAREAAAEQAAAVDPASVADRNRATAQARFRDGIRLFAEGDTFGAIRVFREAVKLQPDNPEYLSQLGRTLALNPKWRKEAEERLLRAIELQPSNGEHYAQLGVVYANAGVASKAAKMFGRALEWDSTNATARKGKADLEGGKQDSAPAGGSLRSLFGERKK